LPAISNDDMTDDDDTGLKQLIRCCLLDPTFPHTVERIDKILNELVASELHVNANKPITTSSLSKNV